MIQGKKMMALILALSYYFAVLAIPINPPPALEKEDIGGKNNHTQEVFATANLLSDTIFEVNNGAHFSFNNSKQPTCKYLLDGQFAFPDKCFFTKENKLEIADVLYRYIRYCLYPFHNFW